MRILPWQVCAGLLVLGASTASAQTQIFGTDGYGLRAYQTDTSTFVASWTSLGAQPTFFPAVDFDSTATDLWAAQYYTYNYGNIDQTNGLYTNVGTISGVVGSAVGMSSDADGSTWWYASYDSTSGQTILYKLDINTGVATQVGNISATIQIDIAVDSLGNLYGHSINDDALYSINTTTGTGTFIGSTGLQANYAQGMDFDWTTNTLYVTHFNYIAGLGIVTNFCWADLATGAFNVLEDTNPVNAEMEMACKSAGGGEPGTPYCFCNVGNPSGNVAPCGNENDGTDPKGAGCQHDDSLAGARLYAGGLASASNDSVVLYGLRGPIQNSSLFVQANNNLDGQNIYIGDGIRCAGGGLIRIQPRPTDSSGSANTTIGIQAKTGVSAGETKYYYWWFRDPNGSPCGNESNASNGYEILWGA